MVAAGTLFENLGGQIDLAPKTGLMRHRSNPALALRRSTGGNSMRLHAAALLDSG